MYGTGHATPHASLLVLSTLHLLHVLETSFRTRSLLQNPDVPHTQDAPLSYHVGFKARDEVILHVLLKDTSERYLTARRTVLLKVKLLS